MLSKKYVEAFNYAFQLHRYQKRKGTGIPYITHLMSVSALVIENGGDEDQSIAALLHDSVEDQGGQKTLEKIRAEFGERVAQIVDGCTDSYAAIKPPWRERKQNYIDRLGGLSEATHLVSLADKVHNARSIVWDLQQTGASVWERFNGGRSGTLWYYRTLADYFMKVMPSPLAKELDRLVSDMERIARQE